MGTTGAGSNPAIISFSSFQNSNCSYAYTGSGDVRNNTTSSGYTGASGINNVYLSSSKSLIISGINTISYTGLSLSYGVYCSGFLTTGTGLTVETSTNGITYTALTRPGNFWLFPGWSNETCTGTIPNTPNLFIRFTHASGGSDFRIDDVKLAGTIVAPTNPTPYNGWPTAFTFNNWAATNTAGTYPSNMIFHYAALNVIHPTLTQITASQNYALAYNLSFSCDSKINGQGTNGISFINTNPGNSGIGAGNIGESVVALNTSCRNNIQVSWHAGTLSNNGVPYKLRAQYRVGTTGSYTDLPNSSLSQIEYTSPGGATNFGPITLPAACNNQAVVELRWAYYYAGSGTTTSDEIYLTDINVSSDPVVSTFSITGGGSYCSGGSGLPIGLSGSQSGTNYQLKNGATNVGSPLAGTGSALSFGNQTAAGTYTVLATNAVTSCTSAMNGNATITINPSPATNTIANQTICGGKTINAINFSSPTAGATFSWTNSNTLIGLPSSGSGNISSFASPVISSPPDQVGVISVTASLSGCTGTATTFSITVKGPQPASVWNGTVSTDWFDSNNWSNCVCGSVTNATVPAVTASNFYPLISGATAANVKNITIAASASVSVQSTQTLNVFGNWINNGTFNSQQGLVTFTGSAAQTLSGSGVTSFYDLTLTNSFGASLSSPQQLKGTLQLNAGTFNTNSQLTMIANASGAARIGAINPAADIINQVTVQQYAPGGATGWALLGSPLSSGATMASWNDNFFITCQSCPNGSLVASVPFTSIYSYNETIAGTYSAVAKYIPITTIANPITNGVGYWTYLGNSSINTSAIMFDVTGPVAKSSCLTCGPAITIPVSRTVNNGVFDDGWNLIANPLPSPISWTALRNGNANVDDAIYAYNADLNSGSGAHTSYINGVSSDIAGGITDVIPMCQGFYIHATGSTNLTAGENIKVNANPTFLKTNNTATTKPIARLVLDGTNNTHDMATFYFEQGGALHFQTDFDSYKMIFDASFPYVASMSDSILTCINGLPALTSNITVPVKAITPSTDSFTFSLLQSDFPNAVCINLYDSFTNISTNLLTSDYACTLYDTTTTARFSLSFFSTPLAGTSNAVQPNCTLPSGSITAVGNNAGPWDYEWKSGNTIIKTSLNKSTADSLTLLSGGNYSIKINTVGQCDNYSQTFTITSVALPVAAFNSNVDTTYFSNSGQVIFTNTSSNAQTVYWDFGDNLGNSSSNNPYYNYTAAGNYNVQLIAQSNSFCNDTITKQITVINDLTELAENTGEEAVLLVTKSTGSYALQFHLLSPESVTISLQDLSGKILKNDVINEVLTETVSIDLTTHSKSVYILKAQIGNSKPKTFKLIN